MIEAVIECEICEEPTLGFACPECGQIVCVSCREPCMVCGKVICHDCGDIGRVDGGDTYCADH